MLDAATALRRGGAHPLAVPAALFALALLGYLALALVWLPPAGLWSPDEGAKLLQLRSLRWESGAPRYDLRYPGRPFDEGLEFAGVDPVSGLMAVSGGQLHLRRLPIFPALTWPLYALLGPAGLYVLPAIAGAGVVALTAALARPADAVRAALLAGLASPIVIYSALFWEHTLASCLGLAALALATREGVERGGWWGVGGLLAAAVYLRLEVAIFGAALLAAAWWLRPDERRGVLLAGAILGVALALYGPLHVALFGVAVPDNARYLFYPLLYLRGAGPVVIRDLLIGPPDELAIDTGLWGWAWAVAAVAAVACAWAGQGRRWATVITALALTVCAAGAAVVLSDQRVFRSAHGLLMTTPWAVVGLCRAPVVWRGGDTRARVIVAVALAGLAGYAVGLVGLRAATPQGGLEWGARFAMTFYPLLALLAVHGLKVGGERAILALLLALGLLGAGYQARGLATIRHDKAHIAALNQALAALPEPIVTDLWWLPFNTAPIDGEPALFIARTPEGLARWVERARAAGVREFSMVTFAADDPPAPGLRLASEELVGAVRLRRVRLAEAGP